MRRCRCSGPRLCSRSGSTSRARIWTSAPTTTRTTEATLTAKVRFAEISSSFPDRRISVLVLGFTIRSVPKDHSRLCSLRPSLPAASISFALPENCGCDDGGARRPAEDGAQITGEVTYLSNIILQSGRLLRVELNRGSTQLKARSGSPAVRRCGDLIYSRKVHLWTIRRRLLCDNLVGGRKDEPTGSSLCY